MITPVKYLDPACSIQPLSGFSNSTICFPLYIPLHARFDGVERVRQVSTKYPSSYSPNEPCLVIRLKLITMMFPKIFSHTWCNTQISCRVNSFSHRTHWYTSDGVSPKRHCC